MGACSRLSPLGMTLRYTRPAFACMHNKTEWTIGKKAREAKRCVSCGGRTHDLGRSHYVICEARALTN